MERVILRVEVGNWDGGSNGQYPKLIEYAPSDEHTPFHESDGWGHGLVGGRFSIGDFVLRESFKGLQDTEWAHSIISEALESGISPRELGVLLEKGYKSNKPSIPFHLQGYLRNF